MVTLEAVSLFRNLNRNEMNALRQISRERRFDAGQAIFKEGDPGDGVYVVKEGLVELSGVMGGSAPRALSTVGPGDIFGEMSVIEHRPRSATATATRETAVYFIPRGEMLTLIGRSPGLAFSLLQDISRRLREFNQLYLSDVLQAERLAVIGRFARGIVHDLKNPLNIIGLTTEMAMMPNATPELRAQAQDRIRKQIERISDLVGEILHYTQGSQSDVQLARVNYAAFIEQIAEELRQECEPRGVKVGFGGKPPAVRLLLDGKRLRRVFLNLAHNALDAMPDGGRITLRFSLNAREILTELEDTGKGIAPEIVGKLFEAFATHGKEHGTGLGLSICKKIIEDHGGRIWARNEPRGGAVFSFALPLPK